MRGFKKGTKPKATSSNLIGNQQFDPNVTSYSTQYANGGVIRGAGTGTSDDIKKDVPAGSYIMPADSTKQIGSQTLGGLGFSPASARQEVPVNVSNGEYELPPEQVHAIGVQALDQMKGATHKPVEMPKATGIEPQLFFANGGKVENPKAGAGLGFKSRQSLADGGVVDPRKKQIQDAISANQSQFPAASAVISGVNQDATDQFKQGNYGGAAGTVLKGMTAMIPAAVSDGWDSGVGSAVNGFNRQATGFAKSLFSIGDDSTTPQATPVSQAVKAAPAAASATPTLPVNATKSATGLTPNPFTTSTPTTTPPVTSTTAPQSSLGLQPANSTTPVTPSGIIRNGNSFSDGKGLNVASDGITPLNPNWNSPQNQNAKKALMADTPTLGQGNQNTGTQPSNTGFVPNSYFQRMNELQQINNANRYDDNIARQNELRMIQPAMFHGSQLTANQAARRDKLLEGGFNANQAQYKQDSDLATQIAKQQMGDQTTLDNTGLQESGANYRNNTNAAVTSSNNNANNTLAAIKLAGDQTAQGFQSAGQRVEANLYDKYAAATTDDARSEIAKQIAELQGKNSDLFAAADGGTSVDASGQVTKNAPIIYNKYTGALANQPQALPPIQSNPAALKIKNDTSLSMDEKRKQLQALGY